MILRKNTNKTGRLAEDFAVNLLISKGYEVVGRNFHSRFGEIDIVALKNGSLIFVEVKARRNKNFGAPEESVSPGKIKKIIKTGEYYSMLHPNLPEKLRIEVISIEIEKNRVVSSKIIPVD